MGLSAVAKVVAGVLVGAEVVAAVAMKEPEMLRPPGALDEADFISKCIKCGRCMEACPYKSLYAAKGVAGSAVGTPTIDVREQACRLCEDLPCIAACPTGALGALENRKQVYMGTAVINRELCIAVKGIRCEVCFRACPLIDEAIYINYQQREGDSIHSIFEPTIDVDKCVGCGLCVERCVVSEPEVAIRIVRNKEDALVAIEAEQEKQVSVAWEERTTW